jgi:hypothetical protein
MLGRLRLGRDALVHGEDDTRHERVMAGEHHASADEFIKLHQLAGGARETKSTREHHHHGHHDHHHEHRH